MTGLSQSASPLSVSSLAQLTLSLLVIVGLILAISWVLRRTRLAGPRGRGQISVLDEITLSPRDRVVLLRVGDSQVLVGIGAGGMVGLTPLGTPIVLPATVPAVSPAFADRLREFMKRPGSPS
jgi:flagellar protein FliO/FliZ